ncbi:ABC transporter substrate-binding protein [Mesorhizobium sp. CCNWLW179-1]|uniref:ABC transporter substrate-binding protein n=1 Tax=unclassified Mesorhizobium TaxID=325217 RepID=UPI0030151666
MKKYAILAAAAASLFAVGIANAEEPPIKIGAVYALTGPVAPYGTAQQKGLDLRVDEINKAGGIQGRKVEVVYYDTEGNGNRAVQLIRRAIESDNVDVLVGPSTSGESLLAAPIANETNVPIITHSAAEAIVRPSTPFAFQTSQYDRVAVPVILSEFQKRGFKTVALMSATDAYGQSGSKVIRELAGEYGLTIASDEQFDRQDTDMTAQVLRSRQGNADVMLIWSTFPAPAIIVRNAKMTGFSKPIFNSFAMATQDFIKQAGAAAENTYVMSAGILLPEALDDANPSKATIVADSEAYAARYNETPNPSAQHALDAATIIFEAAKNIEGPINRQSLRDAIEKTDLNGANGYFKFSPEEHGVATKDAPIVFLKVVGGKYTAEK